MVPDAPCRHRGSVCCRGHHNGDFLPYGFPAVSYGAVYSRRLLGVCYGSILRDRPGRLIAIASYLGWLAVTRLLLRGVLVHGEAPLIGTSSGKKARAWRRSFSAAFLAGVVLSAGRSGDGAVDQSESRGLGWWPGPQVVHPCEKAETGSMRRGPGKSDARDAKVNGSRARLHLAAAARA